MFVEAVLLVFLRFILPGDVDLDDFPYEDLLSDDEELEMKKEKEKRKRQELLANVDFSRYACFTTNVGSLSLQCYVPLYQLGVKHQFNTFFEKQRTETGFLSGIQHCFYHCKH